MDRRSRPVLPDQERSRTDSSSVKQVHERNNSMETLLAEAATYDVASLGPRPA